MSKQEFIQRLRQISVDDINSPFPNLDDALEPEQIKYKGDIDELGFSLVPIQNLFGTRQSARIKGSFEEGNGKLFIEAEVQSFSYVYLFLFLVSIIIYGSFAVMIIYLNREHVQFCLIITALFVVVYGIAFTIYMWIFRKGAKAVKHEVERDLYYLTRNDVDHRRQ